MNIIKKSAGIALLTILFSISGVASANASIFDWTKPVDTNSGAADAVPQGWSFDTLYQSIRGFTTNVANAQTSSGQSDTAVASVTNPSTSVAKTKTAKKVVVVEASGYSSSVDETDDTPFITAKGTYVRDGIVAANFLPFGTAIKIPEIYGNKIFIVEDRMNSRYWYNVDVWFASKEQAMQFGRKTVKIEIVS